MHIHIGLLTAINLYLMWLIMHFFWLTLAYLWRDTTFGQAMGYVA